VVPYITNLFYYK